MLPTELVESLNQTYFLHLLLNDREKVVPPGKSLLSMMIHANFRLPQDDNRDDKKDPHAALVHRVKEAAHKAFWREAVEALSSPIPSVQLQRLKTLFSDLYQALIPLFPPNHLILSTLAAPPSPTSSPLLSTLNLLKDILIALHERCAPIRDTQIDSLLSTISFPPTNNTPPSTEPYISPLAQFLIDNMRSILSLAEQMKSDLTTFVLGSMTEEQLLHVLSSQVVIREREFVLSLWGDDDDTSRERWQSWLAEGSCNVLDLAGSGKWIDRLLRALEADKAVFCPLPNADPHLPNGSGPSPAVINNLPPQLFFTAPTLAYIQNHLQAIVITAALRLLAKLPPGLSSDTFVQRIWTLLKSEIDADSMLNPSFSSPSSPNTIPETKLINLADEVVRTRSLNHIESQSHLPATNQEEEEKHIRTAVDRTLRTTDPVYVLLKKRLFDALQERLVRARDRDAELEHRERRTMVPERMQTGRQVPSGSVSKAAINQKRVWNSTSSSSWSHTTDNPIPRQVIRVQGFEGSEVLSQAIDEAYEKLEGCLTWTERVWGEAGGVPGPVATYE